MDICGNPIPALVSCDEAAAQLQAVLRPNERKARPTCKKGATKKKSQQPHDTNVAVWEISDGEVTCSWGPNQFTDTVLRYNYKI